MKRPLIILTALAAAALFVVCYAMLEARSDPIVRKARIAIPGWPAGAAPVGVVLISDIHIGTIAMGPARLTRIVRQINALKPDLVLIAGDFIYGHAPDSAARIGAPMVAPLSQLRAPLGVVAVLGNHDHWTGAAATGVLLERAGIAVLENDAVQRGPLAIGGLGDEYSRHSNLRATLTAMRPLTGARIVLAHSSGVFPKLPANVALLLAGHTHCGQIVLPVYGPLVEVGAWGAANGRGLVKIPGRVMVTTGGLGTSVVPLRLNAPPDLWLLTLGK